MRIAVVDDEKVFRQQIADQISSLYGRENVSCFLFSDGKELVRSFENGFLLDAIFLDIEMSGLNGIEAADLLQKRYPTLNIVFVTGHPEYSLSADGDGRLRSRRVPFPGKAHR